MILHDYKDVINDDETRSPLIFGFLKSANNSNNVMLWISLDSVFCVGDEMDVVGDCMHACLGLGMFYYPVRFG